MAFDVKEKIEEMVEKLKNDKDLYKKFQNDPVTALEGLIGIDLPNDEIEALVDGIQAKLKMDSVGDVIAGIGGLFKK